MSSTTRFVRVTLLRLSIPGTPGMGTAFAGRMVQFGGIGGHAFRGRLVEFRGDVATTRDFDLAWSALEGLSPLLREFCAKPVEISAVFDTADSWTHLTLDVMFNEQHNCVHLVMMASGVEGPDTRLFDQIVTTVEGLVPAKPQE